ncbi:MAG: SWIM zinc finger family protein [Saprospiraceae bacterium]|nr:SWIM zinc finger family protein [Saprospiraceae bacterium]
MDYHDFEEHVHAIILERGKEYFDRGAVHDIDKTAEGWTMSIEGQTQYTVVLRGHRRLEDWFCECPHAHGPVCKHVVAALYAVRRHAKQDIEQSLDTMTDDELRTFLANEAVNNPQLYHAILRRRRNLAQGEEEE